MSLHEADLSALARAGELARRGRGEVEPNPPVGAVLHRNGLMLAEGWHRAWGEAHAEIDALAQLAKGGASGRLEEATLVVTLEPCSSSGKKQPACVDALCAAGVRRVVVGEIDPDPRHTGRGIERLRAAGIEVVIAPAGVVAPDLLADFRLHLRRDRPWVLLKWAAGLDGNWGCGDRDARWISGDEANREVHRLRAHVDALLVGSGTLLADDPLLTARPPGPRPLVRIVVDGRGRADPQRRLFRSVDAGPVWWVTAAGTAKVKGGPPAPTGVESVALARPHALAQELLPELKRRGIARLLVEGGPTVAAAFLNEEVVDQIWVFVAPVLQGGTASLPRLGAGGAALPATRRFEVESVERSGCDAWIKLRCR